jgi:hypothetical protein
MAAGQAVLTIRQSTNWATASRKPHEEGLVVRYLVRSVERFRRRGREEDKNKGEQLSLW